LINRICYYDVGCDKSKIVKKEIKLKNKRRDNMENIKRLSLEEIADRDAIRAIIDEYAYCADTRDAEGQMSLFTEDTLFRVFMDERQTEPSQVVNGREGLAPTFDNLNTYVATMHFNGQSKIILSGDTAIGTTYCFANHLTIDGDEKKLMVAAIRYYDDFIKINNKWFFKKRDLKVAWIETKPLNS
jgi:ketosteroid isomerase-like protein